MVHSCLSDFGDFGFVFKVGVFLRMVEVGGSLEGGDVFFLKTLFLLIQL